jgi:hypothetical protein
MNEPSQKRNRRQSAKTTKPDTPETVADKCKAAWAISQQYFEKVYGEKRKPTTTKGKQ